MREKDSVVTEPSRHSTGKKIDTWDVIFPHKGYPSIPIDIYMTRDEDTVYTFFAVFDKAKGHPFTGKLVASTPTELKDLLNNSVQQDIEKYWSKKLLVNFDSYHTDNNEPDEEGDHELAMTWGIVYSTKIGKNIVYVKHGEVNQYALKSYGNTARGVLLDWTQKREDTLRGLGAAIHRAHTQLHDLLTDNEAKFTKALDTTINGKLLMTGGN